MKCVVQIWWDKTTVDRRNPSEFSLVELQVNDFEQACHLVDSGVLIPAFDLFTKKGGSGERIVFRREPIAFRGAAVLRMALPTWRLVEEGE